MPTIYGSTLSFYTSAVFPQVITLAATDIAENHATLNGYLQEDVGSLCWVWFEWGASRSYGMETPGQGGVSEGTSFLAAITGLTPGVLYHCRALVSYWGLVYYGNDVSFTTLPLGHMMTLVAPELTTDL